MPPGGDGFYYFLCVFVVAVGEQAYFDIQINGEVLCSTLTDKEETTGDEGNAACSAVITLLRVCTFRFSIR